MSRVLAEIPAEWLARPAQSMSRDEVSIPLHLAVSAVRADELVKRTPSVERNPELKDMPNLFSMGGMAAAKPAPKTDALFGAVPPRPLETTVKQPLPASTQPGSDMFERPAPEAPAAKAPAPPALAPAPPAPAPAPPAQAPARGGKPGGFTFEFNEAATPFRRADEVKEEIAGEEAEKAAEAAAEKAPPAAQAPQMRPEPPAVEAESKPSVSTPFDPFAPMPAAANLFAPAPKSASAPPPAPVVPPAAKEEEPAAAPAAPAARKPAKPLTVLAGPTQGVHLHGVDLNLADAEALAENLPGVGARMAARIIRYRNQQGPFSCMQDLVNVPGIGPSTYEKMTGASWSEARDELRRTLDHLLGKAGTGIPDLRSVARRIANQPGFSGCILVHKDGHVLAGEWPDDKQNVVGAIAPQLFKKVAPYVDQLGFGEVNPITLCFGEDVLTLVHSGEIVIGTLHEIERLDKNQLRLIQLAGAELEDRMERTRPSQDS
jgi:competence ComEA-like helix-hairpin-helix protein